MDKILNYINYNLKMDKCNVLKRKIEDIDDVKHTYCYDKEKLESGYCIALVYQKWLLEVDYQKYCINNISDINKNVD